MAKISSKNSTAARQAKTSDPAIMKLFTDSVKDIYWAEKHLLKALPKMGNAATSMELKDAINNHVEETKMQVTRLEQVFELLGKKPQAKKCDAMEGLIKEGGSIVEETEAGTATRDVGIIMASQKIEHYEIATYGSLRQLASTLGLNEAAHIFEATLGEETAADALLTKVAENGLNYEAAVEMEMV